MDILAIIGAMTVFLIIVGIVLWQSGLLTVEYDIDDTGTK